MESFVKFIGIVLFTIFCVIASPFVAAHIMDNWDKPSYPHSGFTPESPTWEAPEN